MKRGRVNGVTLAYEEAYGAGPPLVFVHGWCCDHTHFAPQFDHFRTRGRRVIAVDLRGHGASEAPAGPYTMATFADDLAALIETTVGGKAVIVGHSMGGIVAFDLAVRRPECVAAIAMVDAAVTLPPGVREAIERMIGALAGPSYREAMRDFVRHALFMATDDPARCAAILETMSATPQHVMHAAFTGLRDFDPDEGGRRLTVPGLYIAANEPTPRADMGRLLALAPELMRGRTVGAGHFCQLEVPDQVNAMLDRFLALAAPPGPDRP
ncbi:alpha/beta fold hydrolase [Acuticoccus kandeliae]|uniref:alpha/beta fold hydrolase n=1 Tax=Acuticoccus kandeliae TaxID=2073160 RepID=UPI000D3E51DE|nr:alpha/beta hydrolase [Acuticoccus kandeliae]